jgi:transcriptional regulator with XRE-family HTH domain
MKALGRYLRELRQQKDLSLRELARKLDGISAAHLSDIELGRRYPSEALLEKMAFVLGVAVDELKKYDPRPPLEGLKRLTESNPSYGMALRTIVEKKISPEDILKLAEKKPDREK